MGAIYTGPTLIELENLFLIGVSLLVILSGLGIWKAWKARRLIHGIAIAVLLVVSGSVSGFLAHGSLPEEPCRPEVELCSSLGIGPALFPAIIAVFAIALMILSGLLVSLFWKTFWFRFIFEILFGVSVLFSIFALLMEPTVFEVFKLVLKAVF